jgi:hypothetical protein
MQEVNRTPLPNYGESLSQIGCRICAYRPGKSSSPGPGHRNQLHRDVPTPRSVGQTSTAIISISTQLRRLSAARQGPRNSSNINKPSS